jgi:signal transduction histidine kinase
VFKRLSLKVKLTGIFVIIFGGSLVAYSVYIYRTVDTVFQLGFDSQLYEFASDIGDSVNFSLLTGLGVNLKKIRESNKFFPFTSKDSVIQIRSLSGQLLATVAALKNQNLPYRPKDSRLLVQTGSLFRDWRAKKPIDGQTRFRVITYLVTDKAPEPLVLQVGVPDELLRRNNQKIVNIFFYSIPFILLLSGFVGYSYAGFSLSPMQRMRKSLDEIKARKLSSRVSLPESKDEIYELAVTINEMLERMEAAFDSQDRFVSEASHQLKTPLAILKGELERLSKDCNNIEDLNAKSESLREEVDSLIALVNNLLLLARVDAGELSAHYKELQMDEVVSTACARLSPYAQAKEINLRLDLKIETEDENPFLVNGDPELLISLFQSLIENSIKYSPEKTTIDIQVVSGLKTISVSIIDEGPGLGSKTSEELFRRFSRGSKSVAGSGLGLSIAKRISDLHAAQVSIFSQSPVGTKALFVIKKV